MNPDGKFTGDTVSVWWRPVANAVRYSVKIEQCQQDNNQCHEVFATSVVNNTRLEETSASGFGDCTIYHLKIVAFNNDDYRILKETALLMKTQDQCDAVIQIALAVTLSVLSLIAILLIAAIIYYFRKHPVHRLQRARSRIYSRLYPRDKYVRPFDKATFVSDLDGRLDDHCFQAEFQDLEQLASDTIQRRFSASSQLVNRQRNRYQDIVPFDTTRVILERPLKLKGQSEASDYINASYISDLSCPANKTSPRYIAAQGPSDETLEIFWEMIWQQNVRVIVMLTRLVEGLGFHSQKCTKYWPSNVGDSMRFRDIEVQLYDCQEAPDYIVRKLDVSKMDGIGNSNNREIVHVQCTSWPDRLTPKETKTLLQLIEVVKVLSQQYSQQSEDKPPGPWLVHCSAGVGRTGTFIAVDQLMRIILDPGTSGFDVFNTVYQLRKERRYMVQSLPQYAFVYRCLDT